MVNQSKYTESIKNFEESKQVFLQNGNNVEANIAEIWANQMLRDVNKVDESHLPEAWRKINHYSLRIGWLHNRSKPSQLEFLKEIKQEHGQEISLEVTGHPGWWLHFNVITASSIVVGLL